MLTKQLQVLIDTSLANGQSYDEIRGMLSLQKFSDSDITDIFSQYDAVVDAAIPQQAAAAPVAQESPKPVTQKVPIGMEKFVPPTAPPKANPKPVSKEKVFSGTTIDLDDGDDISFVEEEAAEQAEYNVKTPTYIDKQEYEAQVENASTVSSTIAKSVEKEVFDIDEDFEEGVDVLAVPSSPPVAKNPEPTVVTPTTTTQSPEFISPAIPVANNVPQQARAQMNTSHVAAQPVPTTDNVTQFGSTLTSSAIGLDFTGKSEVDAEISKSASTPPQLGWYDPAMQQSQTAVPQQQAAVATQPVQQQYTPPVAATPTYQNQQSVQVGLGGIPELSAATQFAQQQQKGKGIGPLIVILVIVLGIIFGFMYWYYAISDLRGDTNNASEVGVDAVEEVVEVERDPFTGQPI